MNNLIEVTAVKIVSEEEFNRSDLPRLVPKEEPNNMA